MDEIEHKIITELSKNSSASQRYLSKVANLSLGMVNIILHRLIEKGYMKIKQLDGRKVQYILTPKGFYEKIERSKQYIKNTISIISNMKEAVKRILLKYYEEGYKNIAILGEGELLSIIELAYKELSLKEFKIYRISDEKEIKSNTFIVLVMNKDFISKTKDVVFVDIMQKIAEEIH